MKDILRLASGDKPLVLRMIDTLTWATPPNGFVTVNTFWTSLKRMCSRLQPPQILPISRQHRRYLFVPRLDASAVARKLVIVCDAKEIENARCNRCNGRQQ
jgi:hypothetical protein